MAGEYILEKFAGGMHYIRIEEELALSLIKNKNNRVLCRVNDQVEFHCALMHKKEGGYFINIGSGICKKLNIRKGSKLTAAFSSDNSKYQFEMPEELQEVLDTDPEADSVFHSLTEGNQRGLIYLVVQVKSTEKRIDRSLRIAEKLKNGITSPKFILK